MLEFMQEIDQLPEFRETVVRPEVLSLTDNSGWQELTVGETKAIDTKFNNPEITWEEAFLDVGYAPTAAKALCRGIMRKPGFAQYKEQYIDSMVGGSDVKIIEDMIGQAIADQDDVKTWTGKDPMKTQFEIRKYVLENVAKTGEKKDGVKSINFFQLIQNNFKGDLDV